MTTADQHPDPYRPLAHVGLAVTGILAGAVVDALTNSINGQISLVLSEAVRGGQELSHFTD
jgi:hypothetical protein